MQHDIPSCAADRRRPGPLVTAYEGMAVLDIRQRTGWLFMAVIVGHILLISAQVNTQRGVPVLEEVTFGTFAEMQRGATSAIRHGARQLGELLRAAGHARARTRSSRRSCRAARSLAAGAALAQQSRTLQSLLDLKSASSFKTTAADGDRRRREPGVPHDHDRQRHRRWPRVGYGRAGPGRRRRSHHHADESRPRRFSCSSIATPRPG